MTEFLTRKDVAEKFKLSLSTVNYLVATKQIPFNRLAQRIVRFSSKELDEWFERGKDIEYRRSKKDRD